MLLAFFVIMRRWALSNLISGALLSLHVPIWVFFTLLYRFIIGDNATHWYIAGFGQFRTVFNVERT